MNYLGHAAVATWRTSDRAFVLGAMLPDFATMIGARSLRMFLVYPGGRRGFPEPPAIAPARRLAE